jgi:hypothetical protein
MKRRARMGRRRRRRGSRGLGYRHRGRIMAIGRIVAVPVETLCKRVAGSIGAGQVTAQCERDVFIDRAGMRFFLLHTQFGQQIENDARFDL